jgi:Immunoglobulin I-set domain
LSVLSTCRWYTHNGPEPLPVLTGPRVRLLGPVLAIEAVTAEDAGTYKCSASNGGGEASAELRLSVATPLHVEISPNVLSVHMGGSAEFRCVVTSNGGPIGPQHITWFKVRCLSHFFFFLFLQNISNFLFVMFHRKICSVSPQSTCKPATTTAKKKRQNMNAKTANMFINLT